MIENDKSLLALVVTNCILLAAICLAIGLVFSYFQSTKPTTKTVDLAAYRDSAPLPAKVLGIQEASKAHEKELVVTAKAVHFKDKKFLGNHVITFYSTETCIPGKPCHTATGTVPRHMLTAAVDPKVIPLNSYIYVEGFGTLKAEDTGGAIKGNRIDIYVDDYDMAVRLGRQTRKVYAVNTI